MSLELVDQGRIGIEMPQSEHGSDLETNLGQGLINAWLHCHSAVYQSFKQFEVVSLATRGMQNLEKLLARIKLDTILTTPLMSSLLGLSEFILQS